MERHQGTQANRGIPAKRGKHSAECAGKIITTHKQTKAQTMPPCQNRQNQQIAVLFTKKCNEQLRGYQNFNLKHIFRFSENNKYMNGLPENIDLNKLTGVELLQISIGRFQCILNFDKNINISIESECLLFPIQGEKIVVSNYVENAAHLCNLIGNNILNTERGDDGGLLIKFSNNVFFRIFNSNTDYESFQLNIQGHLYVA